MEIIQLVSGPVVGAVIGYFTNYIAVKMLFRPRNPVKIGKVTLPLTPGIIPKRKGDLAASIGKAVGDNLFTGSDLAASFTDDAVAASVAKKIADSVFTDKTVGETVDSFSECGKSAEDALVRILSEKIKNAVLSLNVAETVVQKGGEAVMEKLEGSMLKMFINEGVIASFLEPLGLQLEQYVSLHGEEIISPLLQREIADTKNKTVNELFEELGVSRDVVEARIAEIYKSFLAEHLGEILSSLPIERTVTDKVNAMSNEEIENLVLSVMKKELGAVVNLGAVIGFIIGIINIFI